MALFKKINCYKKYLFFSVDHKIKPDKQQVPNLATTLQNKTSIERTVIMAPDFYSSDSVRTAATKTTKLVSKYVCNINMIPLHISGWHK